LPIADVETRCDELEQAGLEVAHSLPPRESRRSRDNQRHDSN
jgi:hypothetical protein